MNILDIETFLVIADTRNLSKAADLLYVSQSTVSYRLKRLEKELDVALFRRGRGEKYIELTPKGETFIDTAQKWTSLWKETQELSSERSYINLRIAQVDWFIAYPFSDFYHNLMRDEPNLKIDVRTSHSIPISEMVNNVQIDIGFVVHPIVYNQLVCVPVFRDPLVMVCSKEKGLSAKKIHPKELEAHKEVFWKYYGDVRIWHDQWWAPSALPRIQIDFSVPLSFELLYGTDCWLVSPKSIAEEQIKHHTWLEIHEFSSPPPDIICYCVYRNIPAPQSASTIKLVLDYIQTHRNIFFRKPYMKI